MRKRLRYRILLTAQAMLIGMACVAFGQPDSARSVPQGGDASRPLWFFGLYGGFGQGLEFALLPIPGFDPACGTFRRGTSSGWEAGALLELPLGDRFSLQLRPSITRTTGSLREPIPDDQPIAMENGRYALALVDQVLEYERTEIGLSALARLELPGRFRLQGGAGLSRAIAGSQRHLQVAVEPEDLLFANGSRELELGRGMLLEDAPLLLRAQAGAAYDLPVSGTSTLSPEIMASIPLTTLSQAGDWRTLSLRIGAALRFGVRAASPPVPPPVAETTAVRPPPRLVSSISTRPAVVSVRIEEYDSTEVLPLLNQIFFAEGSATLRAEYRLLAPAEANAFSNAQLLGSALDVYYHVLNVAGRRLRESDATLAITGYRNGRESDAGLSMRRAEAVRRYLADVWKIPLRRLKTAGRGLPPDPSREATSEGYEENARVEIIPSDPNILAPVFRRHIQRLATPSAITFYMRAVADAGVARWSLAVDEEGAGRFRMFEGNGHPPDSIVWNWRSNGGELPKLPLQLRYTFTVADSAGGLSVSEPVPIDVAYQSVQEKLLYRVRDTTIENFSLLLFNYDSPKVSQSDEDLLRAIAEGVSSGAHVRFTGYTDSLGDETHNRALATARAQEAAAMFRGLVPSDVTIVVDEDGGEWERFPFTTPEGRSHCRTVVIEVRTPKGGDGS